MYDDLLTLLRTDYGWDVEPSARPYKPTIEKALADGRTPEAICAALNAQVNREAPAPVGHPLPNGLFGYKLNKTFGGGAHFSHLATEQALGYQLQEAPFKGQPPALYAEPALELMSKGWRFDGQSQFLDLSKPEDQAEYDRRYTWAMANRPRPWNAIDPDLWVYLVMTGEIPSAYQPFGSKPHTPYDLVFGLSFQKYLDNQWAVRRMQRLPWLPDGSENK
jgi:hypothetical protein